VGGTSPHGTKVPKLAVVIRMEGLMAYSLATDTRRARAGRIVVRRTGHIHGNPVRAARFNRRGAGAHEDGLVRNTLVCAHRLDRPPARQIENELPPPVTPREPLAGGPNGLP